jgi:hypothetical protein
VRKVDKTEFGRNILIRLKRFTNNLEKLMTDIDIPDIIMVGEKNFRLEAYAVHVGETLGLSENEPIPHYVAVVK